jgi:ankyrin repeat protein
MKVMNVTPFLVTLVSFILSVISPVSALSDEETELFSAIRLDDPDILRQLLLEKRVDINVRGQGGQTPLMHAVLGGKEKSVKVLLEEGADVSIGETDGYTRKKLAWNFLRIRQTPFCFISDDFLVFFTTTIISHAWCWISRPS